MSLISELRFLQTIITTISVAPSRHALANKDVDYTMLFTPNPVRLYAY